MLTYRNNAVGLTNLNFTTAALHLQKLKFGSWNLYQRHVVDNAALTPRSSELRAHAGAMESRLSNFLFLEIFLDLRKQFRTAKIPVEIQDFENQFDFSKCSWILETIEPQKYRITDEGRKKRVCFNSNKTYAHKRSCYLHLERLAMNSSSLHSSLSLIFRVETTSYYQTKQFRNQFLCYTSVAMRRNNQNGVHQKSGHFKINITCDNAMKIQTLKNYKMCNSKLHHHGRF